MLQEPSAGMLTASTRKLKRRGMSPRKPVPRAATRTAFTYVAVLCDNKDIQSRMPQIVVVNKNCYTEASHARVLLQLPDHIIVWRRPSAWMNLKNICEVIEVLGKYFWTFHSTHHFILGLDAAKVHLNQKVWQKAKKYNIYMYCIPAESLHGSASSTNDNTKVVGGSRSLTHHQSDHHMFAFAHVGIRVFENFMSMPGGRLMAKHWHSRSDCRGSCGDESLMFPRKCQAEGSWQQSCKASPSLGRLRRASGCRTG